MEVIGSASHEKAPGLFAGMWLCLKTLPAVLKTKIIQVVNNTIKVGKDDPRRIIHSIKVGLALTLVSIFYYCQQLYDNFGVSAMWAVMTVVVVFEFYVGATLGKGLNRGLSTLMAGALGIGAHHLASLSGEIGEPILLGFFVFLQAAASTFIRFFPKIKARYDYGLLIFILTFSLISISGFRGDEILKLAHRRLSTVIIGGSACVIISILICPVWAGQDLHNLIAANLEKLGKFLEGFGNEYFKTLEDGKCKDDKSFMQEYKSVLNSKSSEESLANFARWEPGHGRFQFRHPWQKYLKIGTLARQCAYRIDALNDYLNTEIQAAPEIRTKIQEACTEMSLESGRALKELAFTIKTMTKPSSPDTHIENSKSAAKNLNSLLKSGICEDSDILSVIPVATVASLLIDVVNCTEEIAESIYDLASAANFESIDATVLPEKPQSGQCGGAEKSKADCTHIVINVSGSTPAIQEADQSLKE